jgi:hypothetical protein
LAAHGKSQWLEGPLKNPGKQIPRGLKPARNDK